MTQSCPPLAGGPKSLISRRGKIKKLFFILCISILPAQAFQDCVITADGKLSDITIENEEVVNISPIYTLMNEKNTLYVQPLKVGKTKICVLKDDKDIIKFDIEVTEEETKIDAVEGFEILTIDLPFEDNDRLTPHPPQAVPSYFPPPLPKEREKYLELDIPPLGGES